MFRRLRRSAALSFSLFVVLTGTVLALSWTAGTVNGTFEDQIEQAVIDAHLRACPGDDFSLSSQMTWIARYKAMDMGLHDKMGHLLTDGHMVWDYYTEAGVSSTGRGENVAWNNYPDDQTAMIAFNGWMNSDGHRAIIEQCDYDRFGIGAFKTKDGGTESKWYAGEFIDVFPN